jgi:hypothetical protein
MQDWKTDGITCGQMGKIWMNRWIDTCELYIDFVVFFSNIV